MRILSNVCEMIAWGRQALGAHPELAQRLLDLTNSATLIKLWPQVAAHTALDVFRARQIVEHVEASVLGEGREGDLVDCGAGAGGVSLLMALVLREHGAAKRVHLFDFGGDDGVPGGRRAALEGRVAALGLGTFIAIHPGPLGESLAGLPPAVAFAHVDCDSYEDCAAAIDRLYPLLAPGGALTFDGYYDGTPGTTLAVNQHAAKTGDTVFLGPSCQATIRRGVAVAPDNRTRFALELGADGTPVRGGLKVSLSTETLIGDRAYHTFLAKLSGYLSERLALLRQYGGLVTGLAVPPVK